MAEFKLSATLNGHEGDVRAVACSNGTIFSASRDGTVRQWTSTTSSEFDSAVLVRSHDAGYINSLCTLRPTKAFPEGLVASAGKDTVIDVRRPGSNPEHDAERLLVGHANNVCALAPTSDGQGLISGAWDAQARRWDIERGETVTEYQGHEAGVWAVLAFDAETVVTACADRYIRIFSSGGKQLCKSSQLPDVPRALCKLPANHPSGAVFASTGNDQIIRFWTLEAHEIMQLSGHESYVYAIIALPNGDLVTSSEDRTARVWRGSECIQVITHPAISVWSVAGRENGDIVTGASDHVVRVFSRDTARQADAETLKAFEDSIKASAIPKQTLNKDTVEKNSLPTPDFLQQKSGTKEGQDQMIREDDGTTGFYQWSMAAQQWIKVGTVVDEAASTGRKISYRGKDYDHVFDVDIEDGKPPLKLPYNLNQNPYEVAQKFIDDNELPATYLDQIAAHITNNAQAASIGSTEQTQAPGSDPWGTDSRYRPGESSASTESTKPTRVLPQTLYQTMLSADLAAIRRKLVSLNEGASPEIKLESSKLMAVEELISQAQKTPADPAPNAEQITVLSSIISLWPPAERLPALDLVRLCAVSPDFTRHTSSVDRTVIDLFETAGLFDPETDKPNNSMMAIRTLGNMFGTESGRLIMDGTQDRVVQLLTPFIGSTKANLTSALATACLNYSIMLTTAAPVQATSDREQRGRQVAGLTWDLLSATAQGHADSETCYRALVAWGTLLSLGKEFRQAERSARDVEKVLGAIEGGVLGKESRFKVLLAEVRDELA